MENQSLKKEIVAVKPCDSNNLKFQPQKSFPYFLLANLFLLLLLECAIATWTVCDKSIPCWDTASHKLNSFYVFESLRHPHLRHISWYRGIFAVSPLYPPLFYIISATLKFLFGYLANTEIITNMIFAAILFCSVNFITFITSRSKLAATLAAVLVFLYPAVFWSSHCALLDFASITMVAAALAGFFWWQENPELKRSIIFGCILASALLTKNNTPIFLVGPLLLDLLYSLKSKKGKYTFADFKPLCIVGITTFIVILPWLALAGPGVVKFIASIQQQNFKVTADSSQLLANGPTEQFSYFNECANHLSRFLIEDSALILSPLLLTCFLLALIKVIPIDRNKTYLLSSIFASVLIASLFRWPHQFRYIVPASVPVAALTAIFLSTLWLRKNPLGCLAFIAILSLACCQVFLESFSPYPLPLAALEKVLLSITHEQFKSNVSAIQTSGLTVSPMPQDNPGIMWTLEHLEANSHGNLTYLMIMPNDAPINCSPFYYLTKIRRDNIEVASPREHSELGDKVTFNQEKAKFYQWYLLKTGRQGILLCDHASDLAYAKWVQFVKASGLYKLDNKLTLPNGDILELYKKKES